MLEMKDFDPTIGVKQITGLTVLLVDAGCAMEVQIEVHKEGPRRYTTTDDADDDTQGLQKLIGDAVNRLFQGKSVQDLYRMKEPNRKMVALPGFDNDLGGEIELTETEDHLIITTPDWLMEECNPVYLKIDEAFVREFGGNENMVKAFAAFVKVLDEHVS